MSSGLGPSSRGGVRARRGLVRAADRRTCGATKKETAKNNNRETNAKDLSPLFPFSRCFFRATIITARPCPHTRRARLRKAARGRVERLSVAARGGARAITAKTSGRGTGHRATGGLKDERNERNGSVPHNAVAAPRQVAGVPRQERTQLHPHRYPALSGQTNERGRERGGGVAAATVRE